MSYGVNSLSEAEFQNLMLKISNGYGLLISDGSYVFENLSGKQVTDPKECRYTLYDLLHDGGSYYFIRMGFSEYFGNVNYQKAIDKVLSYYSVKDNWDGEYHLVLTVDNVNKQFVFKEVFKL